MEAVGDGGGAPTAGLEKKINKLSKAEGLHTVVYEKLEYTTTVIDNDGGQESCTGTVVMHGLICWGKPVRGLTIQRDHLGLEPPR